MDIIVNSEDLDIPSNVLWAFFDISNPIVAWEVYTARLIPAAALSVDYIPLSIRGSGLLRGRGLEHLHKGDGVKRKKALVKEIELENLRQKYYNNKVSRLTGMYYFEAKTTALQASKHWAGRHFNSSCLAEVAVNPYANFTRVDSNWITNYFLDELSDESWMHHYWQGLPCAEGPEPPLWEIITNGKGVIWGTTLREDAYNHLKEGFPNTLGLLELARVSAELGSNLGHIVPFVGKVSENIYTVQHIIDFEDATNPEYLKKFREYDGPRNYADLRPDEDIYTMDLRPFNFTFELNSLNFPLITINLPPGYSLPPDLLKNLQA